MWVSIIFLVCQILNFLEKMEYNPARFLWYASKWQLSQIFLMKMKVTPNALLYNVFNGDAPGASSVMEGQHLKLVVKSYWPCFTISKQPKMYWNDPYGMQWTYLINSTKIIDLLISPGEWTFLQRLCICIPIHVLNIEILNLYWQTFLNSLRQSDAYMHQLVNNHWFR